MLNGKNFPQYNRFYCILNQMNAALVKIRDFFKPQTFLEFRPQSYMRASSYINKKINAFIIFLWRLKLTLKHLLCFNLLSNFFYEFYPFFFFYYT